MARLRSQQFSEAGANQRTPHEIAGFILTGATGRDQAYPQRRASRSPRMARAWHAEWISCLKPNLAEFM